MQESSTGVRNIQPSVNVTQAGNELDGGAGDEMAA